MKAIITIVCLATSILSMAQLPKTDLEKEYLKGKIMSIKDTIHRYIIINGNDKNLKKQITYYKEIYYNIEGNKMSDLLYSDNGSSTFIEYIYDEQKNLIEEMHYMNGQKYTQITYEYPDENYMAKTIKSFYNEDIKQEFTYHFDEPNYKITENHYYNRDKPSQITTYQYNEKGQLIEETNYSPISKYTFKYRYKYNEQGLPSEKEQYDNLEAFNQEKYKYETYDEKGNWAKKKEHFTNSFIVITEREIEYYQ